jgi:predicted DNA-binding protein with PD1-like motif
MIPQIQELVSEQTAAFSGQVSKIRKESVDIVREAVVGSADNIKALKTPVRVFARSGVKLTSVSQTAVSSLIELQSDMLTSALSDMALRLERAARADNLVELVKDQFEMLPATRARVVEDAQRAVHIFKVVGRDLREVAAHTYERVVETAEEKVPEVKAAKRKVKRAVRKTTTRARKAA